MTCQCVSPQEIAASTGGGGREDTKLLSKGSWATCLLCITPLDHTRALESISVFTLQIMVSSSSSSEAVEAVLGIVAKGNAILAEISRLAEVLVLVYVVVVLGRNTCYCRCCCFTTVTVAVVLLDDSGQCYLW